MSVQLYTHPFSSYSQKVLIALYVNDTPFEPQVLAPENEQAMTEWERLWPLKRFPVLVDGDRTVVESSTIIEYLELHYPGPVRLIPADPDTALNVRIMDRFFDNYIMAPMQKIVGDALRPPQAKDSHGVTEAHMRLDTAYRWLDDEMSAREWAVDDAFTLADCAAAPSLFYADWVHPIAESFPNVRAYRQRLLAYPPFARAVDEARPYRPLFPPGAPDRD